MLDFPAKLKARKGGQYSDLMLFDCRLSTELVRIAFPVTTC